MNFLGILYAYILSQVIMMSAVAQEQVNFSLSCFDGYKSYVSVRYPGNATDIYPSLKAQNGCHGYQQLDGTWVLENLTRPECEPKHIYGIWFGVVKVQEGPDPSDDDPVFTYACPRKYIGPFISHTVHAGPIAKGHLVLRVHDLYGEVAGTIMLGTVLQFQLTFHPEEGETGVSAISCKAANKFPFPSIVYDILIGGCGANSVLPKDLGFYIYRQEESVYGLSAPFRAFKLGSWNTIQYMCSFVVCGNHTSCNGESCKVVGERRKRHLDDGATFTATSQSLKIDDGYSKSKDENVADDTGKSNVVKRNHGQLHEALQEGPEPDTPLDTSEFTNWALLFAVILLVLTLAIALVLACGMFAMHQLIRKRKMALLSRKSTPFIEISDVPSSGQGAITTTPPSSGEMPINGIVQPPYASAPLNVTYAVDIQPAPLNGTYVGHIEPLPLATQQNATSSYDNPSGPTGPFHSLVTTESEMERNADVVNNSTEHCRDPERDESVIPFHPPEIAESQTERNADIVNDSIERFRDPEPDESVIPFHAAELTESQMEGNAYVVNNSRQLSGDAEWDSTLVTKLRHFLYSRSSSRSQSPSLPMSPNSESIQRTYTVPHTTTSRSPSFGNETVLFGNVSEVSPSERLRIYQSTSPEHSVQATPSVNGMFQPQTVSSPDKEENTFRKATRAVLNRASAIDQPAPLNGTYVRDGEPLPSPTQQNATLSYDNPSEPTGPFHSPVTIESEMERNADVVNNSTEHCRDSERDESVIPFHPPELTESEMEGNTYILNGSRQLSGDADLNRSLVSRLRDFLQSRSSRSQSPDGPSLSKSPNSDLIQRTFTVPNTTTSRSPSFGNETVLFGNVNEISPSERLRIYESTSPERSVEATPSVNGMFQPPTVSSPEKEEIIFRKATRAVLNRASAIDQPEPLNGTYVRDGEPLPSPTQQNTTWSYDNLSWQTGPFHSPVTTESEMKRNADVVNNNREHCRDPEQDERVIPFHPPELTESQMEGNTYIVNGSRQLSGDADLNKSLVARLRDFLQSRTSRSRSSDGPSLSMSPNSDLVQRTFTVPNATTSRSPSFGNETVLFGNVSGISSSERLQIYQSTSPEHSVQATPSVNGMFQPPTISSPDREEIIFRKATRAVLSRANVSLCGPSPDSSESNGHVNNLNISAPAKLTGHRKSSNDSFLLHESRETRWPKDRNKKQLVEVNNSEMQAESTTLERHNMKNRTFVVRSPLANYGMESVAQALLRIALQSHKEEASRFDKEPNSSQRPLAPSSPDQSARRTSPSPNSTPNLSQAEQGTHVSINGDDSVFLQTGEEAGSPRNAHIGQDTDAFLY